MYTTYAHDWKLMHRLNRALFLVVCDFTHASLARTVIQCVQFEFLVSHIIYMTLVDKCATLW